MSDKINPTHYKAHPSGVECIQITEHMDFCLGNAMKYIWRAGLKETEATTTDLEKAIWYIQRKIDQMKIKPVQVEMFAQTMPQQQAEHRNAGLGSAGGGGGGVINWTDIEKAQASSYPTYHLDSAHCGQCKSHDRLDYCTDRQCRMLSSAPACPNFVSR